ncbi:hypothetical protein [Ruegeria arenilitoris]|uniref:hypothetical protein n=1 Tax=Ruegeria arenilitoris TaxID=1173585 RepID=UPI00147D9952|nr:hypothetical protein [Ruegeria arenilitoris]
MELDYTDDERDQLRLWRRWRITFDWFNYPEPLQRVHQALLVHRQPWSTRALATYTNMPQTSVRRQLDLLDAGNAIERTEHGVQINQMQVAFNSSFHRAIADYVHGGVHLNKELLKVFKQGFGPEAANFEMLENHVWWPVIKKAENGIF